MSEFGNEKTYAIFETAANRKIIEELTKNGANVFLFPALETKLNESNETESAYFNDLKSFDWLVFSDVLTVDYFLEILENKQFDIFDLDELRVCAFGEAVSDRLRFSSVHADVIPAKIEPAEVFAALRDYIGAAQIGGLKFLFVQSELEKNRLTQILRENNAEVVEMPVYRTIANEAGELVRLKTLLKGGAIDEFILTAPGDLIALKKYFKPQNLAAVLSEIKIVVTGGVMFQAAKENNLSGFGLFQPDKIAKVS